MKAFVVAGEPSGDKLGAGLMSAMRKRFGDTEIMFSGVGGEAMAKESLTSIFPISDISVMGIQEVVFRLPLLLKRIKTTVQSALDYNPDVVVLIDSQDFSKRVAAGIRKKNPSIPIILWVSPTVWAWRPGRAAAMKSTVDHILAVLPFEPEVHKSLGGPPCSYVGHPLADDIKAYPFEPTPLPPENGDPIRLLLLPGSRNSELKRHMRLYEKTLDALKGSGMPVTVTIPAVTHLRSKIKAETDEWDFPVTIVGQEQKIEAFRSHHGALATSGTVILELAIHGVPTIAVYKTDPIGWFFKSLVRTWTILLPNFIVGRPFMREFIDDLARPEILAKQLEMILTDTPERRALIEGYRDVRREMVPEDPSTIGVERVVDLVLETIERKKNHA